MHIVEMIFLSVLIVAVDKMQDITKSIFSFMEVKWKLNFLVANYRRR